MSLVCEGPSFILRETSRALAVADVYYVVSHISLEVPKEDISMEEQQKVFILSIPRISLKTLEIT